MTARARRQEPHAEKRIALFGQKTFWLKNVSGQKTFWPKTFLA